MKTLKKIFAGMFSLVLCATLFAAPAYADGGTYVFDEMGVLSSSEVQTLESQGAEYAQKYGIGVYILFTDTMGGTYDPSPSQRNNFARQFYEANDLGVGANKNGIIVVVAVKSRDYVTVKHFSDASEDPFSNDCVNVLEENYTSYLSANNWYGAARSYYNDAGSQMAYFAANGKQWTEPDPIGFLIKVLATLLVPAIIAFSVVNAEKAAMKTAREASEASNYLDRSTFKLSKKRDDFVNTTMAVAPIPKESKGGGGGGWSSMGGGFSGSGGGKF